MAGRSRDLAQTLIAIVAGVALLYFFRTILIPLVLAAVLAVLVNWLVRFIGGHSRGVPHWAIVILTALIVIVSVVAAVLIVAQGMVQVVQNVPALLARADQLTQQVGYGLRLSEPLTLQSLIGDIDAPRLIGRVAGSAGNLVSGLVLLVTFFGFMVAGRRRISRKIETLAGTTDASVNVDDDLRQAAAAVETYVWVQTVTGLMIALVSGAVMVATGLDNPLFWTIVVFLLCYLPVIGSTAGSILPALFALLQFPTWWPAVVIFGATQAAATIVGNVIYPRLQAQTQNIDPLATLVALGFWSILWGMAGAFLAVPLTLIVMMVCVRYPGTRWVAVFLSNDGRPTFPVAPAGRAK